MKSTDLRLLFITARRHLSFIGYSFWLQTGKTIKVSKKDTAAMDQLRGKVTIQLSRSSPSELFLGKGFLKICRKFTGEHPCRSAISVKLLCNFIKIALQHGCSPINLLHIFRTHSPRNTSGWLLLVITTIWFSTVLQNDKEVKTFMCLYC